MKMKNSIDLEKIKKEQVKNIKKCIEKFVSDNKEYYQDKEYAEKFKKYLLFHK